MNKTRFAILGLLAERPYSGYELKQVVELRFALFWRESYGQLYPELKRMEGEGLVTSQTTGSRRKTTYAVTDTGKAALVAWLGQPSEPDLVRSERLLKLYFAAFADPATRQGHLDQLRDETRRTVVWLEQAEAQLCALLEADATHPHALSVVRLGLATQRAQLAWAEAEGAHLPRLSPPPS